MTIELKIPEVGESVTEALIGEWFKAVGDPVEKDEPVVELETDKVTVELPAPDSGVLTEIRLKTGETGAVGDVIGTIDDSKRAAAGSGASASTAAERQGSEPKAEPSRSDAPAAARREAKAAGAEPAEEAAQDKAKSEPRVMPAARRALAERGLEADQVEATGPGGRLLKEDVDRHARAAASAPPSAPASTAGESRRQEEVVPMTPIRRRIAERLVDAQRTAALLTTFNEVDMSAVVDLRHRYREVFEQKHGIKLGFMSFFVKATVDALRQFPQLNALVRDEQIVYRNYFDVGIAVSTERGLLVPVLRNAERLGFAEIEKAIGDFGARARSGKIKLDELEGGTFTITNGGIFGSMLSTPIVNPPQSGVLGLHAIEDRPIARDGEVVIHPMMYVALTYDHRIVDGREAVTFLRRIKEAIEEPTRMLLEI